MKKMKLKILLTIALLGNALPINGLFVSKINKNPRTIVGVERISIPTPTSVPRPIQPGTPNVGEATMIIKNLARESNVSSQQIKPGNSFSGKQSSGFLNWLRLKLSSMLPKKKTSTNFSGSAAKPIGRRGYSSSAEQSQEAVSASERSFWSYIPGTNENSIELLYEKLMRGILDFQDLKELERLIRETKYNPLNRLDGDGFSALGKAVKGYLEKNRLFADFADTAKGYLEENRLFADFADTLYLAGARLQKEEKEKFLNMVSDIIGDTDRFTYDQKNPEKSVSVGVILGFINNIASQIYPTLKKIGLDIDEILKKENLSIEKLQILAEIYQNLKYAGENVLDARLNLFQEGTSCEQYGRELCDYIKTLQSSNLFLNTLKTGGFFKGIVLNNNVNSFKKQDTTSGKKTEETASEFHQSNYRRAEELRHSLGSFPFYEFGHMTNKNAPIDRPGQFNFDNKDLAKAKEMLSQKIKENKDFLNIKIPNKSEYACSAQLLDGLLTGHYILVKPTTLLDEILCIIFQGDIKINGTIYIPSDNELNFTKLAQYLIDQGAVINPENASLFENGYYHLMLRFKQLCDGDNCYTRYGIENELSSLIAIFSNLDPILEKFLPNFANIIHQSQKKRADMEQKREIYKKQQQEKANRREYLKQKNDHNEMAWRFKNQKWGDFDYSEANYQSEFNKEDEESYKEWLQGGNSPNFFSNKYSGKQDFGSKRNQGNVEFGMSPKDKLIQLLGLSSNASKEEIKKALNEYRKLNHPDLTPHNLSPKEREKEIERRNGVLKSINDLSDEYNKTLQREQEITE